MTVVLAATQGLSIDMSQTIEQQQGTAPAIRRVRGDLELFWRIIAGLMVLIIAWIIWVLYQISPRSVVTPLAIESQRRDPGSQAPAFGAASAAASMHPATAQEGAAASSVPQPSPEALAAALAMEQAQAGMRSGAHQSSADIQRAVLAQRKEQLKREQQLRRESLKLATEITTPLAERNRIPKEQQTKSDGAPAVPAAADAAGKARP